MVLRTHPLLSVVVLALAAVAPGACLPLNPLPPMDGGTDATTPPGDSAPGPAPDATRDQAAPADAGDASASSPDVTPPECTAGAVSCSADDRSIRTCDAQGHWMVTAACSAQTTCSAGVCVCPGNCAEEPLLQVQTPGFIEDLTGGGPFLYLAVNGPQASIRRFELATKKETVVKTGEPPFTFFALDSDGMGNLLWCSDITGPAHSGQVVTGMQQLDAGACTHVRRHDNLAYFKGDNLYRRALDASMPRQTVTTERMTKFELAGEYLYFIDNDPLTKEASLKRLPLGEPTKVEVLLRQPDAQFLRLLPDASHVYVIEDGEVLRVPLTGAGQPEVFGQQAGWDAWAMAQTDTHLYWSASITSAAGCSETQVFRKAKAGGAITPLSRTQGHCAGQLVRIENQLYTAVWGGYPTTVPTKILRIRP